MLPTGNAQFGQRGGNSEAPLSSEEINFNWENKPTTIPRKLVPRQSQERWPLSGRGQLAVSLDQHPQWSMK